MSKKLFDSVGADKAREERHLAEVGGRYSDGNAYIGSYLDGARALTDRALMTGDGTRLIYSAIFLYRHAIELVLKELLFSTQSAPQLWSQLPAEHPLAGMSCADLGGKLEQTHSLECLLNWVAALPAKVVGNFPPSVRSVILEVHYLDPHAQTFRYARPRAEPTSQVFSDARTLDLTRIHNGLEQAIDWLLTAQLRLVVLTTPVEENPYLGDHWWRPDENEDDGGPDADDASTYFEEAEPEQPEPGETKEERWHVDQIKGELAIARRANGTAVELPRCLLAPDIAAHHELRVRVGLSRDSRVWKAEVASLTSVRWLDYTEFDGSYQPKVRPPEDW